MAGQSIVEATRKSEAAQVEEILSFLRKRGPRASQAGDGRERATAGVTGLTPADRSAVSNILRTRHHADTAVKEQRAADAAFSSRPLEAQLGRPLEREDIIKRLRSLNSNFIFERSNAFPDIMGIYYPDDTREEKRRHIMGFEFGYSPEWTVPHPEAESRKKLTRGWRELVIRLAREGYFALVDGERAFDIRSNERESYVKAKYAK